MLAKIKDLARRAFRDQQTQDTEGGVPCSVSFISGYIEGFRYQQDTINELEKQNKKMKQKLEEIKERAMFNQFNFVEDLARKGLGED